MTIPEGLLQTLLDTEPECVKVIGTDGTILEMNRAGLAMLEAESIEHVRGRHIYDFIEPAQRDRVQQQTRAALLTGGSTIEFDTIGLKGGRRRLESRMAPLRDAEGDLVALLSVTRDITERARLQKTVAMEREHYQLFFEHNPVPMWVFDPDSLAFLAVNEAAVRQLGWPREKFLAMKLGDLKPAAEVPALLLAVRHAAVDEPVNYGVWRLEIGDGMLRDVELVGSGTLFRGRRARLIAVQDVTRRRTAEQLLQAGRDRIVELQQALVDITRSMADAVDLNAALRRITETASRVLDVSRVRVWRRQRDRVALRCLELPLSLEAATPAGDELSAASSPRYLELLASEPVVTAADPITDPRTSELVESYLKPLGIGALIHVPIRDQAFDGMLSVEHIGPPRPWTDEEQTTAIAIANVVALAVGRDEQLRIHQRLTVGLGVSALLRAATSLEAVVPQLLEELCSRLGWTVSAYWRCESTKDLVCAHVHGSHVSAFEEASRHLRATSNQELPGRVLAGGIALWRTDVCAGSESPRDAAAASAGLRSVVAFPIVSGTHVLGVIELWHRTRLAEDPELTAVLTSIGAHVGQFIVRVRADEQRRETFETLRALVESAPVAIVALDLHGRTTIWNPAAERMFGWTAAELLGRDLPIVPPDFTDQFAHVMDEIKAGRAVGPLQTRRRRRDGTELDVTLSAAPIRDATGRVVGRMGVVVDESQRIALETQLRQAQKMEAVGRLAGGVAHDFNNLLTAILGYADLVTSKLPEDAPARAHIDEIRQAAERAVRLVRQLLAFSRRQVLQPRVLNVNDVVSDMAGMLRRLIGENISLSTSLAPDVGAVCVDVGQIEQIIMNLVVNARDAMPKDGSLLIETANVEIDDAYARHHADVAAGSYVRITVTDNGCGMSRDTLSHIFEPFFTTKEQGRGTGLGLSLIHGIVRQSGGHIWVYSEPGRGTTFKIHFPRVAREPDAPAPARGSPPVMPRGRETVLIVEDEPSLRALTRQILESCGYGVLEAGDGEEALSVADHTPVIHLVVTDVVMPRLNGRDMTTRMRVTHPSVRVLFMSGYTQNVIGNNGVLDPSMHLIEKPFTPSQLARRVREVLDEREPS